MTTVDRWQAAQQYERSYWESVSTRIETGSAPQMDWYRWRAEQLAEHLRRLGHGRLADGGAAVVEVGSGPVGVVSYFPGTTRVAVDPLHSFYGADPVLAALRDPLAEYRTGVGERLPCDSDAFDLAIIENCIDHVHDVHGVMRELMRVLRPGGVLYLTVNGRTRPGYYVHRALSRLRIDRGHPHTFTPRRAQALLARHGFQVFHREVGSALEAHLQDLRDSNPRKRMKGVLGVSEYLITLFARKPGGA